MVIVTVKIEVTDTILQKKSGGKMFLRTQKVLVIPRRYVQALYISPEKRKDNFAALEPVLDFDNRLKDRTALEKIILKRNVSSKYNLNDIYSLYDMTKVLNEKKMLVERRRHELTKLTRDVMNGNEEQKEKENKERKYRLEGIALRQDAKNLRNAVNSLEENLINRFLDLPNNIHPGTPEHDTVYSSFNENEKIVCKNECHLGFDHQVEFINRTVYYLLNDAAILDANIPLYFSHKLKLNDFIQFSNMDFAKTLIVEGGAVSLDDVYEVKHISHEKSTNFLHLVGNGSFLSFLGFITKLRLSPSYFPLKWLSIGKIYSAKNNALPGLFGATQSSAVQVFLANKPKHEDELFDETVDIIEELYQKFDIHFRIVRVSADNLAQSEQKKIQIEMFSPYLQKYIEVGHLSSYSDYISKRLLFCYEENKKIEFSSISGGTIINITKVLAILLETYKGNIRHLRYVFDNK